MKPSRMPKFAHRSLVGRLLVVAWAFILCGCPKVARAQVPVNLAPLVHIQFTDGTGKVLSGGFLYTYQAGTTTRLDTYTDSTGTIINAWPIPLDATGAPSNGSTQTGIWLTSAAYKFCALNSALVQMWCTDNVIGAPFLSGNNNWTGNQTFAGTSTFNGSVLLNGGGTFTGSIAGSPAFTGAPAFTGTPTFSNLENFPLGISTDIINGTSTAGGALAVTGANGGGASSNGEYVTLTGGNAGTNAQGGGITLTSGNGGTGASAGAGGTITIITGSGQANNAIGGPVNITPGPGAGTGAGGTFGVNAGVGGSGGGPGGNVNLQAGAGGTGGNGGDVKITLGVGTGGGIDGALIVGQSGRLKFNNDSAAVAPTCSSTGTGASGTCTMGVFSTDTSGQIQLGAAGAGPASTGVVTLTFHASMGGHGSYCMASLAQGTGTWGASSTVIINTEVSATATMTWTDSTGALTAGQGYLINYWCRGIV